MYRPIEQIWEFRNKHMHPMHIKSTDLSQEHTMRKGQSSANGAGKMDNNMQIKKEKLDPCLNTLHKNQITVDLRFKI